RERRLDRNAQPYRLQWPERGVERLMDPIGAEYERSLTGCRDVLDERGRLGKDRRADDWGETKQCRESGERVLHGMRSSELRGVVLERQSFQLQKFLGSQPYQCLAGEFQELSRCIPRRTTRAPGRRVGCGHTRMATRST